MPPRKRANTAKAKTKPAAPSKTIKRKSEPKGSAPTVDLTPDDVQPFEAGRLPTEILCEILKCFNDMDDKPPKALCCFMRVSRRFRDIALAAHSLWAQHVGAPTFLDEKGGPVMHDRHVKKLIMSMVNRAGPALLDLRVRKWYQGPAQYQQQAKLLPTLLPRSRSVATDLNSSAWGLIISFWESLQSMDLQHLEGLSVTASWFILPHHGYASHFPYNTSPGPFDKLHLPALRALALKHVLPPRVFPELRELSLHLDHHLPSSSRMFIDYVRAHPQLTQLTLHDCLRDDQGPVDPIELPHLERLEVTCRPKPCAFFLRHVQFPRATAIIWQYDKTKWYGNDEDWTLDEILKIMNECMEPDPARPYRAFLRLSRGKHNLPGDGLNNKTLSQSEDVHVVFALYRVTSRDLTPRTFDSLNDPDLVLRVETDFEQDALVSGDDFLRIVHPSHISALTMSILDSQTSAFVHKHASNILRSFSTITDFTWLNLTTPGKLAGMITSVLDPSTSPHLKSMCIKELGHVQTRQGWRGNVAVSALCEGLKARRKVGCALKGVPEIGKLWELGKSKSDKTVHERKAPIEQGSERWEELLSALAEAQGAT
ncbi:unnamed protein product [Peniophora sp. CBMAI 1063]|nr:unnamed protein product [Peniophora sp. CBMAI 1063]